MWSYEENSDMKAIERIEYSKHLYDDQVYKAKKEEYIKDLLLEDYARNIRGLHSRYDFMENIIKSAIGQFDKKLKKERADLETIKQFVMEDFLNNDKSFKMTKIITCGYESYAYNIEFEKCNTKFYIAIPMRGRITSKNITYANYGMFEFIIRDSECSGRVLIASYNIEDIADFIKEYFKLENKEGE